MRVPEGGSEVMLDEVSAEKHFRERSITLCQDDYEHWSANDCIPSSGKPVWFTRSELQEVQHIFFDDNVKPLKDDSIVAVRRRNDPSQPFQSASGEDTVAYHGILFHRVTPEAVLSRDWFLQKILESLEKGRQQAQRL